MVGQDYKRELKTVDKNSALASRLDYSTHHKHTGLH